MGALAVLVTRLVYWIEDAFEKLPIHWAWWPALGGIVVGLVGWTFPAAMHVGYDKIDGLLEGRFAPSFLAALLFWKLIAWSVSLGSGTSGGTLAPLFMLGGAVGSLAGHALRAVIPGLGKPGSHGGTLPVCAGSPQASQEDRGGDGLGDGHRGGEAGFALCVRDDQALCGGRAREGAAMGNHPAAGAPRDSVRQCRSGADRTTAGSPDATDCYS
jgi:hypothetical protein